ncbi:cytochrome c oxidase subunit II [Alicyclobacillus curvatus]|nr:cytochrome c oxidase subunit II [Alicyclobacillus curvatus]
MGNSTWLPAALTHFSQSVDGLFYGVLGVVTFFFVLVEVLLVVFLVRYRRTKRNAVGANVHGNNKLEILWTLIPALILVAIGVFSVKYVYAAQVAPAKPIVIKVIGHEWKWEFQYPNGVDTFNDLRVPAGQNVLFDITSADVIHGFYVPAVRLQQDALPGRQTQFWINVESQYTGQTFPVPCDQFCGPGHPTMVATMKVMSPADFQTWLQTEKQAQKTSQG